MLVCLMFAAVGMDVYFKGQVGVEYGWCACLVSFYACAHTAHTCIAVRTCGQRSRSCARALARVRVFACTVRVLLTRNARLSSKAAVESVVLLHQPNG